jgi:hypothetical protein
VSSRVDPCIPAEREPSCLSWPEGVGGVDDHDLVLAGDLLGEVVRAAGQNTSVLANREIDLVTADRVLGHRVPAQLARVARIGHVEELQAAEDRAAGRVAAGLDADDGEVTAEAAVLDVTYDDVLGAGARRIA